MEKVAMEKVAMEKVAALFFFLSVAAALVADVGLAKEIVEDFNQCDRDCRWAYGFYNRSITGKRVYGLEDPLGPSATATLTVRPLEKKVKGAGKTFDSAEFWCGNFSTDFVCALDKNGARISTTRKGADSNQLKVLHCGKCAACSSPEDLMVIYNTRNNITTQMTKCSTAFAKPKILGGSHDLDALRACLRSRALRSAKQIRLDPPEGPTCMDCWTDNIMCDSNQCKWHCIEKFFHPDNDGNYHRVPKVR